MERLSIGIFGSGALGSLVGGYLSRYHDITLYGRPSHMQAIATNGLMVAGVKGEETFSVRSVSTLDHDHFDLGIIAAKAYATQQLLTDLDRQGITFDYIASLQNGLKDDILIHRFGPEHVLGCVVNEAAKGIALGRVEYSNQGSSYFGSFERDKNSVARTRKIELSEILATSLEDRFKTGTSTQMHTLTWYKFMSCVPGFAIAGAFNFDAAQMFASEQARKMLFYSIQETKSVALEEGVVLQDHPLLPEFYASSGAEKILERIAERVCALPTSPVPSLVQDLRAGKTITEADNTLGTFVGLANSYSIDVPLIDLFYHMIKAREEVNSLHSGR